MLLIAMLVAAYGGAKAPTQGSSESVAEAPKALKRLKIGYLNVMDDAQTMLAKDGGFYAKNGLDVELQVFSSGTDLIKGIVRRATAGRRIGLHEHDSGIKTVADLKGKKLASQQKGSTADIVLNGVVLPQAGPTPKDLTMIYVDPAVAVQSLMAGQVDAAFVFEPYESIATATAEVEVIYEVGKVWPFPCMVVITSGKQLAEDREAINALLDAQKEAMLMMEKQPRAAAKLLYKWFIQEEQLAGTKGAVPAVDVVQKAIESQMFHWEIKTEEVIAIMLKQGLIKNSVEVNTILDLSWQKKTAANAH